MCIDRHFFYGLMLDVMEICYYKRIYYALYGDTHCNVAYESWIYHMCASYIHLLICMNIWIGSYGCNENDLLLMLLHGDGHFV